MQLTAPRGKGTAPAHGRVGDLSRFEEVLAAEGLAPLDARGGMVSGRGSEKKPGAKVGDSAATAVYLDWAKSILRVPGDTYFKHRRADAKFDLRRAWSLHADGRSLNEIARELGVARRAVSKALHRVLQAAPSPPVVNPWRRTWRDEADYQRADPKAMARLCRLAVRCSDLERLRELVGNDPVLTRLLPQEGASMANEEKKGAKVEYAAIKLKEDIQVPGSRKDLRNLVDVEGRPHAGGIDVFLEGTPRGHDKPVPCIVTVPWHKISQADRVVEEG